MTFCHSGMPPSDAAEPLAQAATLSCGIAPTNQDWVVSP